jgi:phosphatidylglycerophosphate synthase
MVAAARERIVVGGRVGVPREAWIVAAEEGARDVAGMPQLLRTACALKGAGIERIVVIGARVGDVADVAADRRLAGTVLLAATEEPPGEEGDPILVARGDRVFHRDGPKTLARAATEETRAIADWDALVVATRGRARELARGFEAVLGAWRRGGELVEVAAPERGFVVPLGDRRAEALLVASLRKPIDGLASRALNRHVSLWLTGRLMRTGLRPNHVTLFTMACGIAAGLVCALGGYGAALAGVLLLELGSVVDGVDGELARLKYLGSRRGEWLDTIADDLANACFIAGAAANLASSGARWAWPAGVAALVAFAFTQLTSYAQLSRRGTGDLSALSWTIADHGPLKWLALCVKRDFFVTLFVPLVALGRLDVVLALLTLGAVAVAASMIVELARG